MRRAFGRLLKWSEDHFAKLGSVKHQTISVTEFKAKCLALLDDIGRQGGTITVTKRGRPLATVARAKKWKSPEGMLAGKVRIVGDIVHWPPPEIWDAVRELDEKLR